MESPKVGPVTSFRPTQRNWERLQLAEKLGIKMTKILNDLARFAQPGVSRKSKEDQREGIPRGYERSDSVKGWGNGLEPMVGIEPTTYGLRNRHAGCNSPFMDTSALSFSEALAQWRDIQGIGKKPRTRQYHAEIVATILAHCDFAGVTCLAVSEPSVTALVLALAHYSAPRYNAQLAALKATLPAARHFKRRRVMVKERPLLDQLQFSSLLEELDQAARSHAGLVIRFLAHTGLRDQ
jgi:hypothetical protein